MHPDIEAGATTVGTLTTLTNTPEGQGGNVQSGIVAGDITGADG